jgi:hypothetical protein
MTQAVTNVVAGAVNLSLSWVKLQAGDTGYTDLESNAGAEHIIEIVRGPNSLAYRGPTPTTAINDTSITFTGITPAGNSAGMVALMGINVDQPTPTTLAGWSFALANINNGAAYWHYSMANDFAYAGGNATFSPFGNGGYQPRPFGLWAEWLS